MSVINFERVEFRTREAESGGGDSRTWTVAQSVGLPVGFAAARAVASVQTRQPITSEGAFLELQLRTSRNQSRWSPWLRIARWGDGPEPPKSLAASATSPAGKVVVDQYRAGPSHQFRFLQLRAVYTAGIELTRMDAAARVEKFEDSFVGDLPAESMAWRGAYPAAFSQYDLGEAGRAACSPCSVSWAAAALRGDESAGDICASFDRVRDAEHDILGNWPRAIMLAGELGAAARLVFVESLATGFAPLADNKLIIASIGFEDPNALPGAPKAMPDGHLLVVTGYDAATHEVLTFDPARPAGDPLPHRYPAAQFANVWIGRSAIGYELGT